MAIKLLLSSFAIFYIKLLTVAAAQLQASCPRPCLPGNFHSSICTRAWAGQQADVITSLSRRLSRRRESSASDGSESTCSLDVWFKKTEFPYIFHRKSLKTILHEFECLYRRQRVICRTDCPSPSNPRPQLAGAWTTTRGWM